MARPVILLAVLLLAPALMAPSASACFATAGVPCGRIYPLILIQVEESGALYDLAMGQTIEVPATLTYKFDMLNEGYTAASPNEPVIVSFEFPRKPAWADIVVEPERFEIPVNNPTYAQPDPAEPTNPQASFVFTTEIVMRVTLTGQAILKDGYDYHKLLVFAKSTESGLYQSGYGIKELRVVPEGALHEADVAGQRDVFTAVDLPQLAIAGGEASFGGVTFTLDAPETATFWEPAELVGSVTPVPTGRMVLAVHDEWGALVASTPPLDAAEHVTLNATFVRPGLHTATMTLLPDAGTLTPPITLVVPFLTGSIEGEGYLFPKTYVGATSEPVPMRVAGAQDPTDPLAQWEREIPFYAFDTAQSASASVTLRTDAPLDLGRGAANIQFSIHDPDGKMLQAGSVDPSKPTFSIRVGSVPVEGWYVLRLRGVGAPLATFYDTRIEVNYAAPHQARNHADGVADATGALLTLAGVNVTLPVDTLAVWAPSDITPLFEGADAPSYQITILDANGTLAYASGLRSGAASFSAPAPGAYHAYVYAQPGAGAPFSPFVRAFTFDVGAGTTTVVSKFLAEDAFEVPASVADTLVGIVRVPSLEGAGDAQLAASAGRAELIEENGAAWMQVVASNPGAQPITVQASAVQEYAAPLSLAGPETDAASGPAPSMPIPGLAIGLAIAALGLVAVVAAMRRR